MISCQVSCVTRRHLSCRPKGVKGGFTFMKKRIDFLKLIVTLLFGFYFFRYIFSPHDRLLIYLVDFVFHEAGHIIFGIFGKFVGDLGGSLMQLLIPVALMIYFFKERQRLSSSLVLMWIGENWINISIYARDARARKLPLHGGEAVTHDWSEILYKLNLLHHDQTVGNIFFRFGVLCMLLGFVLGLYFSLEVSGDKGEKGFS